MADVALITGGGNGIGRAVALRLAGEGITVVIADWAEKAAAETRAAILSRGGRAEAARVDVRRAAEVGKTVAGVVERHGRLDILANIAGGSIHRKPLVELTWAEW